MKLQNILADIRALETTAEIGRVGAILNETIEEVRGYYRVSKELEASKPAEPTLAAPLARPKMVCDTCGRSWYGNELDAVGTVKHVTACGLCANNLKVGTRKEAVAPAASETSEAVAPAAEVTVPDGKYTVVFGDGAERTIRIKTQEPDATWMPGKRVASYLNGPDNFRNYQGFAFVDDDNTFRVWNKYAGASALVSALGVLLSGKEQMVNGLKAYGMASGKCGICGRELTRSDSILAGIGPICAGKLGI
jgi:hypothetical protein